MSLQSPFALPGRFWRGNIHTHSTASDGCRTPEAVCAVYRNAGYNFLCISDHFLEKFGYPLTDTTPFQADGFVTIRGAELHAPHLESGELWHILGIGLPADFAPPEADETGASISARALKAGAFVAAAHPAWYLAGEDEIRALGAIHAIETWNVTSADLNARPDSWYVLDRLLSQGARYTACVGDDAHFTDERDDALRAWVLVKSEELSATAIVDALKRGAYYSSTGPEIVSISQEDRNRLRIRSSPANWLFATGGGAQTAYVRGVNLTEATVDISTFTSPWCRVTVRDDEGRFAWSNPIRIDT